MVENRLSGKVFNAFNRVFNIPGGKLFQYVLYKPRFHEKDGRISNKRICTFDASDRVTKRGDLCYTVSV